MVRYDAVSQAYTDQDAQTLGIYIYIYYAWVYVVAGENRIDPITAKLGITSTKGLYHVPLTCSSTCAVWL